MRLVERTFHLKNGKKNVFEQKLHNHIPDMENDDDLHTFSIIKKSEDNDNDIRVQLMISDSCTWEERLKKDYVKNFLANTDDCIDSIDTNYQEVIKFHSKYNKEKD